MKREWWLILVLWALAGYVQAQQPMAALKAAYVYNFTKFIDWPAAASGSVVTLCLIQPDPELEVQFRALDGRSVGEASLRLLWLTPADDVSVCHVLYSEQPTPIAGGVGVLVVTDQSRPGSVINFSVTGQKLRFDIDRGEARRRELKISSRLLRLAREVR